MAESRLVTTYPQPDRSAAGANRALPDVPPVLRDLTETVTQQRDEHPAPIDGKRQVLDVVLGLDTWGDSLARPVGATDPTSIIDRQTGDVRYALAGAHTHDAADVVSGVLDVARLGTGTPSAQTYLDGSGAWSEVQQVRVRAKNVTVATITAGTPVVAKGSVGASGAVEVGPASASSAANMPAIGCVEEDLAANAEGHVIALGVIRNVDTQTPGWTINQTLYVGSAGGLTSTRPTATTDRVQNIARVIRVASSTGEILVLGAGRTNDVPNYAQAKLLGRGDSSGAGPAEEISLGTTLTMAGTTLSATPDAFRAIVVTGQNTIYAAPADTLEFVAGTGITLTTDDVLKTVTIDSTGGGGLSDGDYGDVTVSGSGTAITIDNDAVTYAKLQNVSATDRVLGRSTAGAGDVEEITCTAAGRALLDDADAAAQRVTLSAERQAGNRYVEIFDDLIAPLAWNGSASGTGSTRTTASAFSATENTVGMVGCFTGTTTTGRASNFDGDEGLWFANGWTWMLETRACVDTLADATNDYVVYLGFCDNNANANEPNDGAYFKYQRSVTGTFWVCSTANNGARTNTTTAVAPANLIMQVFKIDVNEAGTSVEFRIDGTLVATHTTNIPSASARSTGIGQKIVKSAGTTSRTLYVDYIHLQGSRTTDR